MNAALTNIGFTVNRLRDELDGKYYLVFGDSVRLAPLYLSQGLPTAAPTCPTSPVGRTPQREATTPHTPSHLTPLTLRPIGDDATSKIAHPFKGKREFVAHSFKALAEYLCRPEVGGVETRAAAERFALPPSVSGAKFAEALER